MCWSPQDQHAYPWSRTWLPTSPYPRAAGVPASLQGAAGVLQKEDRPVWRGTWGAAADAGEVQRHHRWPGETQPWVIRDTAFHLRHSIFTCSNLSSLNPGYLSSINYSGRYASVRGRLRSCRTLWVTCRSTFSKRENSLCGCMQKMTD